MISKHGPDAPVQPESRDFELGGEALPNRRVLLLQMAGVLGTTLFSGCREPVMYIHDSRFEPLSNIIRTLSSLEDGSDSALDPRKQFRTHLHELEQAQKERSFGKIKDVELDRSINELISELNSLSLDDLSQVARVNEEARLAFDLLCKDETKRELRQGMK